MARMGPIVLVVIAIVLLLVLRSIRNMILSMLIVAFSVIWTFGLLAMLGIPIYAVSTMILVMLVAIGVAYSIRIFNSASVYVEEHPTPTDRYLADHAVSTVVGFLSSFTPESDIARTDRFVNEHFAGTSTLNIVLESGQADTFKNPAVLSTMARLQDEIETDADVGDSFALTDFVKRMHQVMHEEDADYYAVPDSRELVAQYLLLYEMSADPDSLEQVVDYAYTSANTTVQVKDDSSQTLSRSIAVSDAYRDELAGFGVSVHYAGSGYRALVFSELILDGQIKSLAISLVIVVALLAIMFRSIVIGLIGATPILIAAVGIGIDYAIHMIEPVQGVHGRTWQQARGCGADDAPQRSRDHVQRVRRRY